MHIDTFHVEALDGAPGVEMAMLSPGAVPEHVRVDFATLNAGSSLPKHPAGREQLFLVLTGEGRVAADDDVEHHVCAGSRVTWSPGEQHTSWADTGMTVLIIQRASAQ